MSFQMLNSAFRFKLLGFPAGFTSQEEVRHAIQGDVVELLAGKQLTINEC